MRVLDDPRHVAIAGRHDCGVATDEKRAARLQRAFVGRIDLDAREAHADDDVVSDADAPVDGDLILLRDAVPQHVEHIGAVGDGGYLADPDPLDLGVEHALEGIEIAGDERAVAPQEKIDGRLAHAARVPSGTSARACPISTGSCIAQTIAAPVVSASSAKSAPTARAFA